MNDVSSTNAQAATLTPPRFLPPHGFLLAVIAELALALFFSYPASLLVRASGAVIIIAGVVLASLGSRAFRLADTNIVPLTPATTLVTTGVFNISRNPMYLGMLLALTGVAVTTATPASALVVLAFYLFVRFRFITAEEQQMYNTFGAEYEAYSARVRRWL